MTPKFPLHLVRPLLPVVLASVFAGSLLLVRAVLARHVGFGFLLWNLFLAWVPLGFALLAECLRLTGRLRARHLLPPLAIWLLFLPNAPYLITDLAHARPPHDAVFWCDLGMIFAFAFAGVMAGLASMRLARATLTAIAGPIVAHLAMLIAAVACGAGIYVGRVLRWNSWDVLTQPQDLLPPIARAITNPWAYRHAAAMSLMFGVLFAVIYIAAELANQGPSHSPEENTF